MSICLDPTAVHQVIAANNHFYAQPTEPLYLNRVLEYHDLIYLVDGRWAITEGDIEYPMERDDVLLLTAGHHHYNRLPCAPQTRTICLHIACAPGDHAGNESAISLPTRFNARSTPQVRQYFEDIVSVMWSNRPYKAERLASLANLLILAISDAQIPTEFDMAERVIRLINNTPHKQFRIGEIAEMFFVSTRTIENAMHCAVNQSFSKYQMNRKLEMAAMQIKAEPDVRFSEIAATLGFCDEFHLSRAFKRKYGMSPSQYRSGSMNKTK